jgi:hypothetical protein
MSRITDLLDRWQIPKSRAIAHVVIAIFTAGFWVLPAILLEVFITSSRENKIWRAENEHNEKINSLRNEIENHQATISDLKKVRSDIELSIESNFEIPFELPIVWLWESREQVTSVTSGTTLGKTRTGTVGLGWNDGIGWAASQGVTRGTIASHTTEMISNEFMQIDTGILRISQEFAAFIGNQFSRTGHYRDILAINTDYDKGIGFSILNAERIWLTRFPGEFEKEIALALLSAARTRTLKSQAIDLTSLFNQFDDNIKNLELKISRSHADLSKLHENLPAEPNI